MANYAHEVALSNIEEFLGKFQVNPKADVHTFNSRFNSGADEVVYSLASQKRGSLFVIVPNKSSVIFDKPTQVKLVNPRLKHGQVRFFQDSMPDDWFIKADGIEAL